MAGIPWYTGAVDAYAKADRSRRQVDAMSGLFGAGGRIIHGMRSASAKAEDENAEIARLRAYLRQQEDAAVTQSQSQSERDTGAAATTTTSTNPLTGGTLSESPLSGPGSVTPGVTPVPRTGESTQPKTDDTWRLGQDSLSDLDVGGTLGGVAGAGAGLLSKLAVGAGLMNDPGRGSRRLQIARLLGQVQRHGADIKATGALSRIAGGSTDPGGVLGTGAPTMGFRSGSITMRPGATSGRRVSLEDLIAQTHPGDPAAAVAEIVRVRKELKMAGVTSNPKKDAYVLAWMAENDPDPTQRDAAARALKRASGALHPDPLGLDALSGGDEKPTPNPSPAASASGGDVSVPTPRGPLNIPDWSRAMEGEAAPPAAGPPAPSPRITSGRYRLTR